MKTSLHKHSLGIVASRFNEKITDRLLDHCLKTLIAGKIEKSKISVIRVPGAYEIPWTLQEMALSKKYSVLIALGCILKGGTSQNDYISKAVIENIQKISLQTRVPCVLGVITPNTEKQALARTRGEMDRGKEAALAALAMLKVRSDIEETI
jgi:6,7-dimethyl-8-ribityllumazine synthase